MNGEARPGVMVLGFLRGEATFGVVVLGNVKGGHAFWNDELVQTARSEGRPARNIADTSIGVGGFEALGERQRRTASPTPPRT